MPILKISCITKTARIGPHDQITYVGGKYKGTRWRQSITEAVGYLENGTHCYYIKKENRFVDIQVSAYEDKKYLKTQLDGIFPDGLLVLPECTWHAP